MSQVEVKDLVEEGLERLITQWKDKPVVVALLEALLENWQLIEDVYHQLNDERGLDTSVGEQLDVLGLLIGLAREGLNDVDYKQALLAQIAINTADGTESKIYEALSVYFSTNDITVRDVYPAGVDVKINGIELDIMASVLPILDQIIAAAILPSVTSEFDLIFDSLDTLGVSQSASDNLSAEIRLIPTS